MTPAHIRQSRQRLRLSQAALGAIVGTDGGAVSRWERGVNVPGPETVAKLEAAFAETEPIYTWRYNQERGHWIDCGPTPSLTAILARIEAKLDALNRRVDEWFRTA